MHPPLNVQLPSPPPDDMNFNDGKDNLEPHEAVQGEVQTLCHPILNGMSFICSFLFYFQHSSLGMPCDAHKNYLPPGTFPPPYALPGDNDVAQNDWDPFYNRTQFKITDFLYRRNQMPGMQVDVLFNLWVASGDNGTESPFSSHNDLYETINAIQLGNVP